MKSLMLIAKLRRIAVMFLALAQVTLGIGCSSLFNPNEAASPGFAFPSIGATTPTVLRIGDRFPAIEGVDLDGNRIVCDPSRDGDRLTLVVFWTSNCGFCDIELPQQVQLAKRYAPSGLRVIGINSDHEIDDARETSNRHQLPWTNIFDGGHGEITSRLGVNRWPTLFLLDGEGRVVMATPELRAVSVESFADGTDRQIDALEWALRERLGSK